MVKRLQEIMDQYALEIKSGFPDYGSIYTYFVEYINEKAYLDDVTLDDFLRFEFSKMDIVKSCAYYFLNSNANKKSAINKYLSSMTKFYKEYMVINGYDNQNLYTIFPFAQLKHDVKNYIKEKELLDKEVVPPITDEDFELIIKYFNDKKNKSLKVRQLSIIFKLILLYGLKLERVVAMKKVNFQKDDFDNKYYQLLSLDIADKRDIILELPYTLSLEIKRYFEYLKETNCNQSIY